MVQYNAGGEHNFKQIKVLKLYNMVVEIIMTQTQKTDDCRSSGQWHTIHSTLSPILNLLSLLIAPAKAPPTKYFHQQYPNNKKALP